MRSPFGVRPLSLAAAAIVCSPLVACSPASNGNECTPTALDANCDLVKDSLGNLGANWQIDIAPADGVMDGTGYDTDEDGIIDAVDTDGDGWADATEAGPINPGPATGGTSSTGGGPGTGGGQQNTGGAQGNTGGTPSTGGTQGNTGGAQNTGGMENTGGTVNPTGHCLDEAPDHSTGRTISGSSEGVRYSTASTRRNGVNYTFMANGWGPGWVSHDITYEGSRFSVNDFQGSKGSNYEPAGYPTVFCGKYSSGTSGACGLPASINSLSEIDTGLSWSHTGGGSDFNVAYDIWMGNGDNHVSFLMLWYRDPPQNQPAGSLRANNVMLGQDRWDVWAGDVMGKPIVNYVRPQGSDISELSFDAMDYVDHAKSNYSLPGDTVLSVAIGFEIWSGPVSDLSVDDFCVNVK